MIFFMRFQPQREAHLPPVKDCHQAEPQIANSYFKWNAMILNHLKGKYCKSHKIVKYDHERNYKACIECPISSTVRLLVGECIGSENPELQTKTWEVKDSTISLNRIKLVYSTSFNSLDKGKWHFYGALKALPNHVATFFFLSFLQQIKRNINLID